MESHCILDKMTAEQSRLSFARIYVEIDVDCMLPEMIPYVNEKGEQVAQTVTYEWIPPKCSHCKRFGHALYACPLKPQKIWVPKKDNRKNQPEMGKGKELLEFIVVVPPSDCANVEHVEVEQVNVDVGRDNGVVDKMQMQSSQNLASTSSIKNGNPFEILENLKPDSNPFGLASHLDAVVEMPKKHNTRNK
ncbi:hypothetical protein ACH5RR_039102 [Cinchona calisaya]|uniref:DUF4283 domain-containing protein n=1 Tax=Cinchona calisaya TaxID=153742 RepID=A0ABD2XXB6_9GENT